MEMPLSAVCFARILALISCVYLAENPCKHDFPCQSIRMAELVLYVEPKQHDIAVLHYIVFSFKTYQPLFLCGCM